MGDILLTLVRYSGQVCFFCLQSGSGYLRCVQGGVGDCSSGSFFWLLGLLLIGLVLMSFGGCGVRELSLDFFRAYQRASGPVSSGHQVFVGWCGRASGGNWAGRLHRVSRSDDLDVSPAQSSVNSSLAPVLLFRCRTKSVADVLRGIRWSGFSQSSGCFVRSLEPWTHWIPPDLHGFYRWDFDAL